MKRVQENTLRIAVASRNGDVVDMHFGHAEQFYIYEADHDGQSSLVETRTVSRYCLGEDTYTHPFEKERFMSVVNAIKDCQILLCSRIGTVPEKRLKESGINTFMAFDRVKDVITLVCKGIKE